ncbi:CxC2 domain-containing protein [Mycena venus]|uniref:CxC2 domain-containing protein n=1 Tax=Mycena venus TaxID=2733690 RepID=A0A8H7DAF8_9AGAR|nr:CxC2 domain-containing protein [Mycena venus]
MLENPPYREYLLSVTDQKEMSTCSRLAALDFANTKFSRGYSTTGVGMGVCACHEFVQPNGITRLRFVNMDYIFASLLCHHNPLLLKLISYDIVCQWWKRLMERLIELLVLVRCTLILPMIAFVIPKMHIHAHTLLCGLLYSLNLVPGSRQTDGKEIERLWANIGGIASSTRIMGPRAQHDMVDDHWGHWNWQKLVSLAATLRRRLDTALEQQVVQEEALKTFSEQQQDRVEEWKRMVHDFEKDPKKKNPYEAVVMGLTEIEVRRQFQREEEEEAKRGLPAKHRVTPSAFMTECLDVEEQQHKRNIKLHGRHYFGRRRRGDQLKLGWKKLKKEDIQCMGDVEDLKQKEQKRKKAKERQKRKYDELLSHGVDVAVWAEEGSEDDDDGEEGVRAQESRREVSWIWTAAGSSGTDADLEDTLRIEWAKAYTRSRRWNEEVLLLREEFLWLPISFEFEADLWVERVRAVPVVAAGLDLAYAQGMRAYAVKQENLFWDLARRAREVETEPKLGKGKRWLRARAVDPLAEATRYEGGEEEEDGEEDDDGNVPGAEEDGEAEQLGKGLESDEELLMGGEVDDV